MPTPWDTRGCRPGDALGAFSRERMDPRGVRGHERRARRRREGRPRGDETRRARGDVGRVGRVEAHAGALLRRVGDVGDETRRGRGTRSRLRAMEMIFDTGVFDGRATGRRRGGALRRRVAAARRTFLVLRLSFSLLFRFKRDGCVVRTPRSFAPSSFVRATLGRSPPSFVRHPRSPLPRSFATLGPPNPHASRDSGERRGGGLERPDVESLKPNESRVVAPRQPRIAVPALGVPLANHRRRVRSPPSRAPNSRRDRVSLSRAGRVGVFLSEERHRATLASVVAIGAPRRARDPRERRSYERRRRTAFPRRERPPPRTSSPREVPSIPSPPLRGNTRLDRP